MSKNLLVALILFAAAFCFLLALFKASTGVDLQDLGFVLGFAGLGIWAL